jgi:hypothetical protein
LNVNEWIKVLKEHIQHDTSLNEAEYVAYKAKGKTICLAGLAGWKLTNYIRTLGFKASVKHVERFYRFKPLEVMEALMELGKLSMDEAEKLAWNTLNSLEDMCALI